MCSTSIFTCIMTIICTFTIIFIFSILSSKFSMEILQFFALLYNSCCSYVNNFIFFFLKLIIFIASSLNHSQFFFMESLPMYASFLFSMSLNGDIAGIEKHDIKCLPTFVGDGFSGFLF